MQQQKSVQYVTMNKSGLLALPPDVQNLTQQSNLQLVRTGKLTKVGDVTTKLGDWFCMGNRTSSTQHVKQCWNTMVLCFGFYESKMDQN